MLLLNMKKRGGRKSRYVPIREVMEGASMIRRP